MERIKIKMLNRPRCTLIINKQKKKRKRKKGEDEETITYII